MSIVAKRLNRSRWYLPYKWALVQATLCYIGTQLPSPKRGKELPQFSAHFYCGQTAGCIKMPFGMELGLSPGDFVLDEDPALASPKRGGPPIFGPNLLWPNGCMDQDATWYGGRPRPTRHCITWGPSSTPLKGHAPNFRPMTVVSKQLDGLRCHLGWR